MATEIWKYHEGYTEAREAVKSQSCEENLKLIGDLFGFDRLKFGDGPEDVKQEALRQIEIEFRSERNEQAEFLVSLTHANSSRIN